MPELPNASVGECHIRVYVAKNRLSVRKVSRRKTSRLTM